MGARFMRWTGEVRLPIWVLANAARCVAFQARNEAIWSHPAGQTRPAGWSLELYLPIICLALSGVMAVVSTVTVGSTDDAQSSNIDFAMSIASFAPVG